MPAGAGWVAGWIEGSGLVCVYLTQGLLKHVLPFFHIGSAPIGEHLKKSVVGVVTHGADSTRAHALVSRAVGKNLIKIFWPTFCHTC